MANTLAHQLSSSICIVMLLIKIYVERGNQSAQCLEWALKELLDENKEHSLSRLQKPITEIHRWRLALVA